MEEIKEHVNQYDLVFFANWLSHIPPQQLDAFLGIVARAVRPGGSLVIVDQSTWEATMPNIPVFPRIDLSLFLNLCH
jgi:2-polyprenyl-3-methyl-5-hydroxy-6-metoxy-1,4-benzoquinol methylase